MARLPIVGGDDGNWGQILNDYLSAAHNTDGTLKDSTVSAQKISATGGTDGQVLTKNSAGTGGLAWRAGGVTSVAGRSGDVSLTKSDVGLSSVDNTSDANKPVSSATQSALDGKASTSHSHTLDSLSDVSTTGATAGQALVYSSGSWAPGSVSGGSTPDATTSTKGVVRLAGDLGGTADAPTVNNVARGTGGGVESLVSASVSGTYTVDLANGNVFLLTLTGNTTLSFTGAVAGKACSFALYIRQDATGSRMIIWPATACWAGVAPALSTNANSLDIIVLETLDGGSNWYGALVGNDFV